VPPFLLCDFQVVLLAWYAEVFTATERYYLLYSQSDPQIIKEIVDAVTIPVMAKVRIGHFVEAQVEQQLGFAEFPFH
jgi:SOR/SNZ family